ncbi:MAG: TatD family deoxyribonuclease [Candidatus Methanofastidiosa archaeon]|nr:TatD family deoxyribonuclease [Candidatus Methanofastidiosa archaeon]
MMNLIDFHVHIDYYKDFYEKYNYYNNNRIYALGVTNLPEIYEKCISSFKKSKFVQFALGYNPQFAGTDKFNKRIFDKYFDTTKYIGEVGLDFSRDFVIHKAEQIEVFDYIAQRAGQHNKILSIHSRNAEVDVINILKKHKVKFAVFHWYTGKIEKVKDIVDRGYYFSVNSKMLQSKRGLTIIKNIPFDRILIETDGPFTDFRKQMITPDKLPEVYSTFEQVLNIRGFEEVVFSNLKKLLINQQQCTR